MKIKDFTVRVAIGLTMAAAAGACTGKDSPNPAAPSPTGGAALLGNWSSSSALPSPAACSDFKWNVTQQSGTSASGAFSAVCPGGVNVNGTATGTLSGTTVTWNAQGTATVPNLPACAITLTGTAELAADSIRVPYSGDTCLGKVSGVEVLRRN